jgi:hypothetical protein
MSLADERRSIQSAAGAADNKPMEGLQPVEDLQIETIPLAPRRRRWWPAIAAGIAVAAVAVAAGIAAPQWRRRNLNANESAAIATMKNISSAQSQMQASGAIDANGNGAGEYGFFAELAGTAVLRAAAGGDTHPGRLSPPVLAPRFGVVRGGRVHVGGYVFQMFLPDKKGGWIAEADAGGAAGGVDPTRAEVEWLCYAWPEEYDVTGVRTYMINQGGDVLSTKASTVPNSGDAGPVPGQSGFARKDACQVPAANQEDIFGNQWTVI